MEKSRQSQKLTFMGFIEDIILKEIAYFKLSPDKLQICAGVEYLSAFSNYVQSGLGVKELGECCWYLSLMTYNLLKEDIDALYDLSGYITEEDLIYAESPELAIKVRMPDVIAHYYYYSTFSTKLFDYLYSKSTPPPTKEDIRLLWRKLIVTVDYGEGRSLIKAMKYRRQEFHRKVKNG